jgi:HAD superfamily hydrolase (TIGR01490 family)
MYHNSLALFDLDHTLLPIDSDYEWGEFLGKRGIVDTAQYRRRNEEFFVQYRDGSLDIREFLQFALEPLATRDPAELRALHADFMKLVIAPQIRPRARQLVRQHQERGELCAVVTATNAFVTAPIAEAFGIAHLIATVPEQRDGRFTGAVRGVPCYREGKVVCVEAWLERLGRGWDSFEHSTFYSDSHNDLALLERVREPVATNPDASLRSLAQARGWRILDIFDDQEIHS